MSRPEALNVINNKVSHELRDVLAQVRANRAVRVVIFSGEGNVFIEKRAPVFTEEEPRPARAKKGKAKP